MVHAPLRMVLRATRRWDRLPGTAALVTPASAAAAGVVRSPSPSPPPPLHIPTNEEDPGLVRLRHTLSHVLAQAVQSRWPEARLVLGPWTEDVRSLRGSPPSCPTSHHHRPALSLLGAADMCYSNRQGFRYDFAKPTPFSLEDLVDIKEEMDRILERGLPLRHEVVAAAEARERLEARGERYKLETLERILSRGEGGAGETVAEKQQEEGGGDGVSLYHTGAEWWDLCAGPHVGSTVEISSNDARS
jgi:threonyl-tRNA synthetase